MFLSKFFFDFQKISYETLNHINPIWFVAIYVSLLVQIVSICFTSDRREVNLICKTCLKVHKFIVALISYDMLIRPMISPFLYSDFYLIFSFMLLHTDIVLLILNEKEITPKRYVHVMCHLALVMQSILFDSTLAIIFIAIYYFIELVKIIASMLFGRKSTPYIYGFVKPLILIFVLKLNAYYIFFPYEYIIPIIVTIASLMSEYKILLT